MRRWLPPVAVLLVWLVLGGLLGPFPGRLAEVQRNDNASFLPSNAESTRVSEIQESLDEDEVIPAVVVLEYEEPVGEGDLAEAAQLRDRITGLEYVIGEPAPPVPSEDGLAIQITVPLDGSRALESGETVERIRQLADGSAPGTYVTGPAGFIADLGEAFSGIDGLVLGVALTVVLIILLIVYRSPLLPLIVLLSAVLALVLASAVVYWLADRDYVTLNGQSQGILFILVVGAATDYALLLVARYREQLRRERSRFAAIRGAYRGALLPITASGLTVILGVLTLLVSELNSNRSLGPVAATGIVMSLAAALTFLPAALVVLGRAAFWPFRPRYEPEAAERQDVQRRGAWWRVARLVGRHPRRVWVVTAVVLAALAAFIPRLDASGVAQEELFLNEVDSVAGSDALAEHFPAGAATPLLVAAPEEDADEALGVLRQHDRVVQASPVSTTGPGAQPDPEAPPEVVGGRVLLRATLNTSVDSEAAFDTVRNLRQELDAVDEDVLVGGEPAIRLDTNEASARDRNVIIPLVLVVILVVLAVLLRAIVAPAVLLLANVLSFVATLGVAALVFDFVFDFPSIDPAVPLYAFVFLVALGIDYSIFLMTRVREESAALGTREGILTGLSVTGGVITSAGVVLAATFSALAVLPIAFLVQIAFLVGFGVL
ncbi:MAG: MMPL family transporter, partial [Actinomycetota bacterium]